jgi:putative transposase
MKMLIRKAFKFRLKPTEEQASALRQQGGNARFLYNLLLERHDRLYEEEHRSWRRNEMIISIPGIKGEFPFLKESFSHSLQHVAIQLHNAYVNFFSKRAKHPRFKSKHDNRDSFTVPDKWRIDRKFVFLPKIGEVSWKMHRLIEGTPKHLTVTQDGDHWFCSVNCEVEIQDPTAPDKPFVGIDLGLKSFAVLSDGTTIENPKHLRKMEEKLRREQRRFSRKVKGCEQLFLNLTKST